MKLQYESLYVSEVHRRTIARLTDEKRALQQDVVCLRSTISKHRSMENDLAHYQRRVRKAEEKAWKYKDELDNNRHEHQRLVNRLYARASSPAVSSAWRQGSPATTWSESGDGHWDSDSGWSSTTKWNSSSKTSSRQSSQAPSPEAKPVPSFMRSTAASRARECKPLTNPEPGTKEDVHSISSDTFESEWENDSQFFHDCQMASQAQEKALGTQEAVLPDHLWRGLLQKRSHSVTPFMSDAPEWVCGYPGMIKLRSRFVKDLYHKALEVAAEVFYEWASIHRPEFIAENAPEGPWDLLLDRSTLISYGIGMYDNGMLSGHFFSGRPGSWELTYLLFRGIGGGLRNTFCHFNHDNTWTHQVFGLVHPVLAFAQEAGDERGAFRAQALLDRLRAEAEETYADIERRVLLSALPEARPWGYHHKSCFEKVLQDLRDYTDGRLQPSDKLRFQSNEWEGWKYGQAVLQAAFEYRRQGRMADLGNRIGIDWDVPGYKTTRALGYDFSEWESLDCDSNKTGKRSEWREEQGMPRTRRPSVHGSDVEAMERANFPRPSRWKKRRDPRETLDGLDLALKF